MPMEMKQLWSSRNLTTVTETCEFSEMKTFKAIPASVLGRLVLQMDPTNTKYKYYTKCKDGCKSGMILAYANTALSAMEDCLRHRETFFKFFEEMDREVVEWPNELGLEVMLRINLLWKIIVKQLLKLKGDSIKITPGSCICFSNTLQLCKWWTKNVIKQSEYLKMCYEGDAVKSNNNAAIVKFRLDQSTSVTEIEHQQANRDRLLKLKGDYNNVKEQLMLNNFKTYAENSSNTPIICFTNVSVGDDDFTEYAVNNKICALKEQVSILQEQLRHYEQESINQKQLCKESNCFDRFDIEQLFKSSTGTSAKLSKSSDGDTFETAESHQQQQNLLEEFLYDREPSLYRLKDGVLSEFKISFKTGTGDEFRDISIFQVVHKTNNMSSKEYRLGARCRDPAIVLARVRNIFNSIMDRECLQLDENERNVNKFSIEARSFELL